MYPMGADILKATPEKTGTSHSLPRFGMMASESVEDLSHMCLGGGQSLESGVRWRFVTVISHRTGLGGPVDCNHSPGLRYDYGKRQLLLHPQQGHFQGLSKAWEGAGGETPTVPQCL